jgi:EpsI family protein
LDNLSISLPSPIFSLSSFRPAFNIKPVAVIALAILLAAISLKFIIAHRSEAAPSRQELSQMPLVLGSWKGKESHLEKDVITALKFNDYFLADYRNESSNVTLNLYIAYYASQRKGASVHSPKTCMPGGGWELSGQQTLNFENILATPQASLTVNKVQIQKANTKNIVFYWFQQRGRIITNEYQAKWLIFWDAITRNRTDGALVRVIASYSDESSKKIAEEEMRHFVAQLAPILPTYLPE